MQPQKTFDHVTNVLIADNRKALESGKIFATSKSVPTFILSNEIFGEASEIGRLFAHFTSDVFVTLLNEKKETVDFEKKFHSLFSKNDISLNQNMCKILIDHQNSKYGICLLWGGETTVTVKGKGKGGRNQELVLSFLNEARKLNMANQKSFDFVFCSAGTDGQDGPTDATGAFVDKIALNSEFNSENELTALNNNDSYKFFETFLNGRCHLKFGLTGTNVMDIQILYVKKI